MAKPQLRKPKKKVSPVKAIKVGTIAKAVKNAREMALLPYSSSAR